MIQQIAVPVVLSGIAMVVTFRPPMCLCCCLLGSFAARYQLYQE